MSKPAVQGARPGDDRRQRHDVRAIFDEAIAVAAPFYEIASDMPFEYWAARALRDAYPALDAHGFQLLLAAVSRACRRGLATDRSATAASTAAGAAMPAHARNRQ